MNRSHASYYEESRSLAFTSPRAATVELRRLHDRRDSRRYIMMEAITLAIDPISPGFNVVREWFEAGYDDLVLNIASDPSIYPAAGASREIKVEVSRRVSHQVSGVSGLSNFVKALREQYAHVFDPLRALLQGGASTCRTSCTSPAQRHQGRASAIREEIGCNMAHLLVIHSASGYCGPLGQR